MSTAGARAAGGQGTETAFPSGDDVGAVVIDLGSLHVQAGNAGDDEPKHHGLSSVGDCDSDMIDVNASANQRFKYPLSFLRPLSSIKVRPCLQKPGQTINSANDGLPRLTEVLRPVEPLVVDGEVYEHIIEQIFHGPLGLKTPLKGKPVLFTEPNKHNRKLREKMAEILFERFEVEAVYAAKRGVLASFSVGRQSGLFVDVGASGTSITPVVDGYTLQRNVKELPVGGNLLDYQLSALLRRVGLDSHVIPLYRVKKTLKKSGPSLPWTVTSVDVLDPPPQCTSSYLDHSRRQVLREVKESICRAADEPLPLTTLEALKPQGASGNAATSSMLYVGKHELPDGTTLNVDLFAQKIPECLFNFQWILPESPSTSVDLSPLEGHASLTHAIASTVMSCDVDCRKDLLGALTLFGGSTLMPGFAERFTRHIQESDNLLGNTARYKIVCPASLTERRFASWIGGSILASLGSFQQMWMSRAEYETHGISLLEHRCIQ